MVAPPPVEITPEGAGPAPGAGRSRTPLRVLHVITGLGLGGAERMLCKLLAGTDRTRIEPAVISLISDGALAPEVRRLGVELVGLGMTPARPSPVALFRLIRAVRRLRPAVIQGWMYHGNLAAQVARAMVGGGGRVYWNIRQSLDDLGQEKVGTRAAIRAGAVLARRVDGVIYNSEVARAQHEAIGFPPGLGMTIPNGFEVERFRPAPAAGDWLRAELGLDAGALVLGQVARYHPMKDHANLLAAAGRALPELPGLQLVLIGSGIEPANAALMAEVRRAGLEGRVHLLGPRGDVERWVPGFDLAVSPSARSEAFPNAVGEAMSCGVPCVVTAVGDCAAIVGETGLVVPPRDPEALAAALVRLAALGPEGRRALGAQARERVIERFELGRIVALYQALYEGSNESSDG